MFTGDMVLATGCRPLTFLADKALVQGRLSINKYAAATYFTLPIDDVIRCLAVPVLATLAHFYGLYDTFADAKNHKQLYLLATVKVLITPVWFPIKLAAKTLLFGVPFLAVGMLHLIFPLRTILAQTWLLTELKNGAITMFPAFMYRHEINGICKSIFSKWPLVHSPLADDTNNIINDSGNFKKIFSAPDSFLGTGDCFSSSPLSFNCVWNEFLFQNMHN